MTGNDREDAGRAPIRALVADGRFEEAWRLLCPDLLSGERTATWSVARNVLRTGTAAGWAPASKREIRLAVLCTYEASEMSEYLRVACLALGIDAELYVAPYGQVEQEILGASSGLSAFGPTHVLIAATTADLAFPELAGDEQELLGGALERWRTLWQSIRRDHGARAIQHGFVVPDETPLGHLSMRLASSRVSLVRELNRRLAHAAGNDALLVDCERLAARVGKRSWVDLRLWYGTRQPVAHEAMPVLARETAAVLAADLGLAARCLVLDLDNTLWGGVVGEDGIDGIAIGEGPDGEAYAAFQDYVAALRARGIVLAVASKNDLQAARQPFADRPEMRLELDDFAMFTADWRRKPEQIAEIADTLGLGLDAIVFADDNPAECAEVAAALPDVTTICLDVPPSERVRTLAASVRFEISALSSEDAQRQRSYAARAGAAELEAGAASLEDFWRSLEMRARVRALDAASLDRAAQLTQKTNQFNLTLRRHSREEIERFAEDRLTICRTLELEDRFASHGLIGLAIVRPSEECSETAEIDTLLLSCRVIGRTAEVHMLAHLSAAALERGFKRMRGVYVSGPRNALVADVYPRLGFASCDGDGRWEYDLAAHGPIESVYISDEQ
ncbi:MAG TPA: HAD-IIIC family phosphatase [Solirubrobacteraceae bacterium]|nr:HAD-IIIC family phosphatase [Solirubrobacteraceae bacterium]